MTENKVYVEVSSNEKLQKLLGSFDENMNALAQEIGIFYNVVGTKLELVGSATDTETAKLVIEQLLAIIESGDNIDKARVIYSIELAREGKVEDISKITNGVILVNSKGKQIKCKTLGQKRYYQALKENTVVFGVGPAGTGKTYLAVASAVSAYKSKQVEKIILTRPAVEAGEKLGFLPGDLQTKVDPYLRPLYDALQEMFGLENYLKLMERGVIEIAPLAYMRGRTLNDAYIILDEAQNTTKEQMKMFLTRMGEGSKMVITGDLTQIDLPEGKKSGLKHAVKILDNVEDIAVVNLTSKDVVRHPLVMRIIKAYDEEEGKNQNEKR